MFSRYAFALMSVGGVVVVAGAGCVELDPASDPAATTQQAIGLNDRIAACSSDPRVVAGTASVDVCVGADLFLRETFGGNGRSCATCHRVDNNMTIDPAFISKLPPSDPLFVAEFDPDLAGLEIPAQMRRFGLILENVDGFAPDPRTHFVLRSVPHTLSLATSVTRAPGDTVNPPIERTGWSGDGAPGAGALRDFQTGAITQHYTRSLARVAGEDFRLADDGELDRILAFQQQIGRTNELALASVVMSDAGAEAGRSKFLTVGCNACHGNAGANASFGGGGNRNFNTGVESSRNPALAQFPHDGGFLALPANPDGSFGNGTFNTPPLIEAADTGPFFHTAVSITGASAHNTDTATTIEEAIAFYDSPAFNNSPSGRVAPIDLTADDIDNIGRFLRGLNATFNAALAVKRLDAATALVTRFHNAHLDTQREMLRLANAEVGDAIKVLVAVPNLDAQSLVSLVAAKLLVDQARATGSEFQRALEIALARNLVSLASTKVGTNLTYQIGDGTVMF
jgi:mono/diheme cytochrome c family protein